VQLTAWIREHRQAIEFFFARVFIDLKALLSIPIFPGFAFDFLGFVIHSHADILVRVSFVRLAIRQSREGYPVLVAFTPVLAGFLSVSITGRV
jgi:hypothetical protein